MAGHSADDASDWMLPWAGGCRCGALRFEVTAPPLMSTACHCRGCQQMTGSAFSLTLILRAAGFGVTAGEAVVGRRGEGLRHMFCPACMSWAFTLVDAMPELVNLRSTLLDDAGWVAPFMETQTAEALPWAKTPAVVSYARFAEVEEYGPLMQRFAAEGRRPG